MEFSSRLVRSMDMRASVVYFLWLASACVLCVREKPYYNFKLVRIAAGSSERLDRILHQLPQIDDLHRNPHDNTLLAIVSPDDLAEVVQTVTEENGDVEILQDNLQDSVDEEFRHLDMRRRKRATLELEDAIKEYLTLDEIYEFQDRVKSSCSNFVDVKKKTIGYSAENRPINVMTISPKNPGRNRKTIFIESGVHAREWLSPATANYIVYQLACNKSNADMIQLFDWEVVSPVNPDGYEFTHSGYRYWRKNRQRNLRSRCVGTDLNRNFGTGFGKRGASGNACSDTYRGRYAYSAPEANALKQHILGNKQGIISYLSIHTYGQYILLPWAYQNKRVADNANLTLLAKTAEKAMGVPFRIGPTYSMLYPAAGITADFARDKAKVARSYTWELMPRTGKRLSGFSPSENLVPFYTPTIWRGIRAYAVAVADEVGITAEDVFLAGDVEPSVPNPYRDSILEAFKNSSMYPALLQVLQNGK
ncbi:zinc carboxypeptidase-like isoform X1 [Haliotis rufescens]|uniref:zinc carboxypeptidase-like isoform X1 n=2 Tax=Haliotis rufescens TaxID=6454 RepID=UPI00201FA914|nr:zinc carboxypeptidase-like isoform X1 [Haliotis rufescens]